MKYTAILTVLMGIVIGCFAAGHYASAGTDRAENPLVLGLVLPLVFAGAVMWTVGGRRFTVSGPATGWHPVGGSGGHTTADPSGG